MRRALVIAGACGLASSTALADPAPKVCIAVAGDPDEAVRNLARETEARLVSSNAWRVVADAATRDALRGESPTPEGEGDHAAFRRTLRSTDADATALDGVGDALGCGWFITVASRASGTALRVYDVTHHRFAATPAAGSFDAPAAVLLLEGAVTPAAASTLPSTAPAAATPAHPSPVAPAHSVPTIARVWPWLVAGAAVLAIVGVVVLLQGDSTPQTTISVVHRGAQ